MSHNYSQHYQFVISLSVGIKCDPVRSSGVIWRRAAAAAVWEALEQGRLWFSDQGPLVYHSRELRRRNLIEHWRMNPPADNHFLTLREELLLDRENESQEKRDIDHQFLNEGKCDV